MTGAAVTNLPDPQGPVPPAQRLGELSDHYERSTAGLRGWQHEVQAARAVAESQRVSLSGTISDVKRLGGAHALLVSVAESQRRLVGDRLERLVTLGLQSVFGPGIEFRLLDVVSHGKLALRPECGYPRGPGGQIVWYELDQVGGGVVDIVAFCMRVALLSMYTPRLRPVIVADEPFKHVSDSYLPAVATMVAELSHSLDIQIVMVSHEQELAGAADQVIRISMGPSGSAAQVLGADHGE